VLLAFILHGEWRVSTAVSVVDNGVEGLVNPLPKHHCWGCPENIERNLNLMKM